MNIILKKHVKLIDVFSFKSNDSRKRYKQYYLPTVDIEDYNVMIDGRNLLISP